MSESIKSLEDTSFDALFASWKLCFCDQVSSSRAIACMLKRRNFLPTISFGAFSNTEDGKSELIAFTLNCLGEYNGILTVYDSGTATAAEFRRRGLAETILRASLPAMKEKAAQQYILEVQKTNEHAISLYSKIGFTIQREFCFFRQAIKDAIVDSPPSHAPEKSFGDVKFQVMDLPDRAMVEPMWDMHPAWQNSCESMQSKQTYVIDYRFNMNLRVITDVFQIC